MTEPDQQCRAEFEAWCFDYNRKRPIPDEYGGYGLGRNYDRWMAWQTAWQAARSDAPVSLTVAAQGIRSYDPEHELFEEWQLDVAETVLTSAGIKFTDDSKEG